MVQQITYMNQRSQYTEDGRLKPSYMVIDHFDVKG